MNKVSIIVPIYNVDEYLERSIESLINQTLKEIEIILVNDGSTDKSLEICKYYEQKDKRIKVLDKKNEGVSVARNKGIELATSEYIAFIDPDDYVEPTMYENMYKNIIESNSDICMCNYIEIDKNKSIKKELELREGIYYRKNIEELLISMVGNKDLEKETVMGCIWRSIYKKSLIHKYKIEFPKGIHHMQDIVFMVNYLSKCTTLYINDNAYYHYYRRDNSSMTRYKKNMWENNKKVCNMLEDILENNNLLELSKIELTNRWVNTLISVVINETHKDNDDKILCKYKKIKLFIEDEKFSKYINQVNTNSVRIRKKLIIYFIKNKLIMPLYIYYYLIKKVKITN